MIIFLNIIFRQNAFMNIYVFCAFLEWDFNMTGKTIFAENVLKSVNIVICNGQLSSNFIFNGCLAHGLGWTSQDRYWKLVKQVYIGIVAPSFRILMIVTTKFHLLIITKASSFVFEGFFFGGGGHLLFSSVSLLRFFVLMFLIRFPYLLPIKMNHSSNSFSSLNQGGIMYNNTVMIYHRFDVSRCLFLRVYVFNNTVSFVKLFFIS